MNHREKGETMNPQEAFKILQEHFNEIIALPEEHVRYGDALASIHDYIDMLEKGLGDASRAANILIAGFNKTEGTK